MVRFIFFCMAVLALSVAAIPVTTMIDGIAKERAQTLAEATIETPAGPDPDYFAADDSAPSADDLNAIDTAAGGTEGAVEDMGDLQSGFSGTPPRALEETAAETVPADATTPQDN